MAVMVVVVNNLAAAAVVVATVVVVVSVAPEVSVVYGGLEVLLSWWLTVHLAHRAGAGASAYMRLLMCKHPHGSCGLQHCWKER
mgnify:CR=1 FL=1